MSQNVSDCVILTPAYRTIEPACEESLCQLETRGYTVRRSFGGSQIDVVRNKMITNALRDGFREIMWIDADIMFDSDAVDRLRSHALPIVCGLYPKKHSV